MKFIECITSCFFIVLVNSCAIAEKQIASYVDYEHLGNLETYSYPCSVSGPQYRQLQIYLPRSYYESDCRYPALYLLHGANGNENSWIVNGDILKTIDSLYNKGEIQDCIYVFPNMNQYYNDFDYGDSRPKKSIDAFLGLNGNVERAFINDVVNFVDSKFRTKPEKQYRAIAGLSIGGFQTIHISAANPNMFGYVGIFSPLTRPPFEYGVYRKLEKKLVEQFQSPPVVYLIAIGRKDIFVRNTYEYCRHLEKKGACIEFYLSEGSHTWNNWKNYSILFMKKLWKNNETALIQPQ